MLGVTQLYVPGFSEKMIKKALKLSVDSIIFDLEDAVALDNKEYARKVLRETLCRELSEERPGANLILRINGLDTSYWREDLELLKQIPQISCLVMPKAAEAYVKELDAALDKTGMDDVKIIPLIETAEGVETTVQIIRASSRVVGVQFGGEDYSRDMDINRTLEGNEIFYARCKVANCARMCGVEALDTPFTALQEEDLFEMDVRQAKQSGFTGKTMIHPKQIDKIREVFYPSEEEIADAQAIIKMASEMKGNAFQYKGKMVDIPIMQRQMRILQKAGIK